MGFMDILKPLDKLEDTSIDEISPELMRKFLDSKSSLESSKWGIVNRDPAAPDKGFNVGRVQWRNSRATNVLNRLKNEDPELAKEYIKDVDKFDEETVFKNKENIEKWLDTETGRKVQTEQMTDDLKNIYIAQAKKNGIETAGTALVWADLAHRYGVNGARRLFINPSGPTTLDYIAKRMDELGEKDEFNKNINIRRMNRFANDLGGEAGAIMTMQAAAKSALQEGMPIEAVKEELSMADIIKKETESTPMKPADMPDSSQPLTAEVDIFKQHLNFLINETLKVKPPEQKKDPINILIEAIITGILGEMVS